MSLGKMDYLAVDKMKELGLWNENKLQDLQEDLRVMHVGRWWDKVQNREEWGRIGKEAKAHPGL
jgi:hypothetical protein